MKVIERPVVTDSGVQFWQVRDRKTELEVFQGRVDDIAALVATPPVNAMFDSLPAGPRVCDLFTGTGAGTHAVVSKLHGMGKTPQLATAVDVFEERYRLSTGAYAINVLNRAAYPMSQDETERNLGDTAGICGVSLVQEDSLLHVRRFVAAQVAPVDLVTGFSIPLEKTTVVSIVTIALLLDMKDIPALFTFAIKAQPHLDNLQRGLHQTGLSPQWNLYEKPQGVGNPDRDAWIFTNRPLDFPRYSTGV